MPQPRDQGRLPIGAEVLTGGGVRLRVWAPRRRQVEVVLEGRTGERAGPRGESFELAAEGDGYFSGVVASARAGTLYRFRLDGDAAFPDLASRSQPEGPAGPSLVVDPAAFAWTDGPWRGVRPEGQVVYEMHVGTFTPEGTWDAAARELPELADLGITLIELMPVGEFPGRFGWGYDVVHFFAPYHVYGRPDDMRRFVDRAHALGVGVILDVIYNHVGPEENCFREYAPDYFTDRYHGEWGAPINYDGAHAGPVRELVLANVGYWIDEFHLDGLRIDATQGIFDASPDHILAAIARRVREQARGRATFLVGENEPQQVRLIRPSEQGGYGLDALWNDDFHHSARVAATGRSEGYFGDYRGTPQELISVAKRGFLYQGQLNHRQGKRRGSPTVGIEPSAFINFLQNHDQIANSGRGERLHRLTTPGRYRAVTALLLLGPNTPMLFQGQEFAASSPFYYFGDHRPEIAEQMDQGRREFLTQFRSLATPEMQERIIKSSDPQTFRSSQLDPAERGRHAEAYALHRDLLRLRREDAVFRAPRPGGVDGAVLGPEAFVLRFLGEAGDDRLLLVNLGADLRLDPAPEPLLAPPAGRTWRVLWSSEDPRYGGGGTAPPEGDGPWQLAGHAALVLAP